MKNDFEGLKKELKEDLDQVLKELKDRDQLLKTVETLKMEKQQLMEKLSTATKSPKQFDQDCYHGIYRKISVSHKQYVS